MKTLGSSIAVIAGAMASVAFAQTPPAPTVAPPTPPSTPAAAPAAAAPVAEPRPADVASADAIVAALYDVISGPPGPRDWNRFRSLFRAGATMTPTGVAPDGSRRARVITPEQYLTSNGPALLTMGFVEREAAHIDQQYGTIAHRWSTYESRHAADDAEPFQRGVNSIQLFNDAQRWWITSVAWSPEMKDAPLAKR